MTNQGLTIQPETRKAAGYCCTIFWVVLFTGVFVFLLTTTLTAYYKNQKLKGYARQIVDDIGMLQANNETLRQEIHALENDPFYLEMVIRRDLHMLGNDEFVIPR